MPAESIPIAPTRLLVAPVASHRLGANVVALAPGRGCLSQQRTRRVRYGFDNPFHRTVPPSAALLICVINPRAGTACTCRQEGNRRIAGALRQSVFYLLQN